MICEGSFPFGRGVRRLPHTDINVIELTKIVGAQSSVVALCTMEPLRTVGPPLYHRPNQNE